MADRIDEVLEFPLPGEDERFKLLKLYLDKYIARAGERKSSWFKQLFRRQQQKIEIKGLDDEVVREAASRTDDFRGEKEEKNGSERGGSRERKKKGKESKLEGKRSSVSHPPDLEKGSILCFGPMQQTKKKKKKNREVQNEGGAKTRKERERKKKRKTRIQARDCESVWTERKDYEENRRSLSNLAIGLHHRSQQPQHQWRLCFALVW